jgi:hypothetical protein
MNNYGITLPTDPLFRQSLPLNLRRILDRVRAGVGGIPTVYCEQLEGYAKAWFAQPMYTVDGEPVIS